MLFKKNIYIDVFRFGIEVSVFAVESSVKRV